MRFLGIVLLGLWLTGCAALIIRDDDGVMPMSGKFATRVVLAIATLGFSEMEIDAAKNKETFDAWWAHATPQEREAYLQHHRGIEGVGREVAPGMMPSYSDPDAPTTDGPVRCQTLTYQGQTLKDCH